MTPNVKMHRLVRVTLVNWYLFERQDIAICEGSVLFRGGNGTGKSSLIDAIQTIFAGGNENDLLMNAASSDGKRSGRTIKSYVLGVVAEANGQVTSEPRKESNTYLCLTFQNDQGKFYAFGLSLYARTGDSKVVKRRFVIDGADITSSDFMESEYTVMPWKAFERRLQTMSAQASFPSSSREYRLKYSELMSAAGPQQQISPDMMWRAIKNGIAFKEQKSISDFTRNYILPANPIDVIRIENDYREYQRIQDLIEKAKQELEVLKNIVKKYRRHESQQRKQVSYQWSKLEAEFMKADAAISSLVERQDELKKKDKFHDKRIGDLNGLTLSLQKVRDETLAQFKLSSFYDADKNCKEAISHADETIRGCADIVKGAKSLLAQLITSSLPASASLQLKDSYECAKEKLKVAVDFEAEDLVHNWPSDVDQVNTILEVIHEYQSLSELIQQDRDSIKTKLDVVKKQFKDLSDAVKSLTQGEARLMQSTYGIIKLLEDNDIEAIPVCELCEVSDPDWQIGIERFLGGNREALVIRSEDYTQAIALYRTAKNYDESLRRVKLINPNKGFGYEGKPNVGTAAGLIESNNSVALKYLRGLLNNVRLVDSEDALRQERRAITKDGMVAGSGAISGGNSFKWVLIGKDARRKHAVEVAKELEQVKLNLAACNRDYTPMQELNSSFVLSIEAVATSCQSLPSAMKKGEEAVKARAEQKKKQDGLKQSPDKILKDAYTTADQRLDSHQNTITEESKVLAAIQVDMSRNTEVLPGLEEEMEKVSSKRNDCERLKVFDCEHAAQTLEELIESLGDENYDAIMHEANIGSGSAFTASEKAKNEGNELRTNYIYNFEPINRTELSQMGPLEGMKCCQNHIDRIESAQLVGYLEEAREAREKMLDNFRAEVVAKLKECFQEIEMTFQTLNKQLKNLSFNNNRYKFIYPQVEIESLKSVYEYVTDNSDLDLDYVGTLFDEKKGHPAVETIQEVLVDGRLAEISDYRNFFTYDIIATDIVTGTKRKFSELLLNGSGGEKQAPFYVALGASFMSAYRIQKVGDNVFGGGALAIFDEAFSKMDGNNAHAALNFFREIGLQVILAAPPESEVKVGPYVDKVYNVLRSGNHVYLDHRVYKDKGKKLLESDDPQLHPELVEALIPEVSEEFVDV